MQPALPVSAPRSPPVAETARWAPVVALAALHGAVTLAWVAYSLYLVELLVRAGFDAYLATVLLSVEGLVAAVLEPLMGALSDRARRGLLRRFGLVLGGVLATAVLFVALPLAARGARPGPASLVPALLIGWSCAMAVFRTPALSLLVGYARPDALPLAASVLTTAGGLVAAAAPSARAWLLSLGALPTFGAASAALLAAAVVVRALDRRTPLPAPAPEPVDGRGVRRAWLLLVVGTSSALAFRFLADGLPRAGARPGAPAALVTSAFFLGMALTALPLGRLALGRAGGGVITAGGLSVLVPGAALALVVDGARPILILAGLLGAGLAALQNGLFAWSLSAVRVERAGLGMGLLLGGGGLALGLFNLLLAVRKPAPATSLLAAAALYALTAVLLGSALGGLRAAGSTSAV